MSSASGWGSFQVNHGQKGFYAGLNGESRRPAGCDRLEGSSNAGRRLAGFRWETAGT